MPITIFSLLAVPRYLLPKRCSVIYCVFRPSGVAASLLYIRSVVNVTAGTARLSSMQHTRSAHCPDHFEHQAILFLTHTRHHYYGDRWLKTISIPGSTNPCIMRATQSAEGTSNPTRSSPTNQAPTSESAPSVGARRSNISGSCTFLDLNELQMQPRLSSACG